MGRHEERGAEAEEKVEYSGKDSEKETDRKKQTSREQQIKVAEDSKRVVRQDSGKLCGALCRPGDAHEA